MKFYVSSIHSSISRLQLKNITLLLQFMKKKGLGMSCVRRAQPCTNPILPANDGKRELGRGVVKIVDARRCRLAFSGVPVFCGVLRRAT